MKSIKDIRDERPAVQPIDTEQTLIEFQQTDQPSGQQSTAGTINELKNSFTGTDPEQVPTNADFRVISTETPSVGPIGKLWFRLDAPGSLIWEHNLHGGTVFSVFERNGVVYSGSSDDNVIAADAEDGSFIWEHELHGNIVWSVFERNGVVYSGSSDDKVIAADASDGSLIWEHELHGDRVLSVFERNGVVYSSSSDEKVIAADASDGSLIWEHELHGDRVRSVFERNGVVYSGSSDGRVIAAVSDKHSYISDGLKWIPGQRFVTDREGGQLG